MFRHNQKVKTTQEVYSHIRAKNLPVGTKGTVIALRNNTCLVKFQGYSWPIAVEQTKLEGAEHA
ncbi:MAG: hypothetical protein AB7L09_21545 [Nitrospira sp.]